MVKWKDKLFKEDWWAQEEKWWDAGWVPLEENGSRKEYGSQSIISIAFTIA
jgi:hypothetical protein